MNSETKALIRQIEENLERLESARLYAFIPLEFGPRSYFVIERSEQEARVAVERHIARVDSGGEMLRAWQQDSYEMLVLAPGEVISNPND